MRILVTGAGGFCGTNLCGYLLDMGYQVRAVDNFHKGHCDSLIPYSPNKNFEFMFGDITNKRDIDKMIEGVDGIIHLAAIVGFPACAKNPALSYAVNVIGTENLCRAKHPDIPLIFSSTGSVYGKLNELCTENSDTNPLSEYGRNKLSAEFVTLNEPNTIVHRFATAFGVSGNMRVNLLINDLTYQAYANNSLVIFQADFKRTFIHVNDMCSSFIYSLQNYKKFKYRVYNVGSPANNWTKRQVADKIKEKTGCLVVFAEIGVDKDQRSYEVDYTRYLAEGWKPNYTIEQGIDELLKLSPLLQTRNPYL
jgi:nucleoside-diphosphate-sugar epimerase